MPGSADSMSKSANTTTQCRRYGDDRDSECVGHGVRDLRGVILVIGGICQAVAGLVGIIEDEFFVVMWMQDCPVWSMSGDR